MKMTRTLGIKLGAALACASAVVLAFSCAQQGATRHSVDVAGDVAGGVAPGDAEPGPQIGASPTIEFNEHAASEWVIVGPSQEAGVPAQIDEPITLEENQMLVPSTLADEGWGAFLRGLGVFDQADQERKSEDNDAFDFTQYADEPEIYLHSLGERYQRERVRVNRLGSRHAAVPASSPAPNQPSRVRANVQAQLAVPLADRSELLEEKDSEAQPNARTQAPTTFAADELWVIASPRADAPKIPDDVPGSGALMGIIDGEQVPTPLEHSAYEANIDGYIASVSLKQSFHNPFSEKIEAVYVFPMPQNAAVNDFVMTVGERRIRGVIREREEAERIYNTARAHGHVASLLNQERANVFTQRVANIEPGKSIDVDITYFHTLAYHDGWYSWSVPMVVGPRYNPPNHPDPILAVPNESPEPAKNPGGAVPYLTESERSGHDVSVRVDLNAGVGIEAIGSPSHAVNVTKSSNGAVIELASNDRIPNKDFVLRWKVAGEAIKPGMITHVDEDGNGYFALLLTPPASLESIERAPIELVFVIDSSGSMSGEPIAQVKEAIRRGLKRMQPGDTFQIINFSDSASQLGPRPLDATPENVERALKHVDAIASGGGTQMEHGITAALGFPHDEERTRFVVFMTDGFIGHDRAVLGLLQRELGPSRVFSFGVGSSPNRYLIERMAKLGPGVVAYLNPGDSSTAVMDAFFDRVSHPALAGVTIDWGGLAVDDVMPQRLPDLYVGRPVIVTGRFDGASLDGAGTVRVRGMASGAQRVLEIDVNSGVTDQAPALASVWARAQIAALDDRAVFDGVPRENEIREIALGHNLMSAYTSFVAVDSAAVTSGASGVTVGVPVRVPEGVRYETTVGGGG